MTMIMNRLENKKKKRQNDNTDNEKIEDDIMKENFQKSIGSKKLIYHDDM